MLFHETMPALPHSVQQPLVPLRSAGWAYTPSVPSTAILDCLSMDKRHELLPAIFLLERSQFFRWDVFIRFQKCACGLCYHKVPASFNAVFFEFHPMKFATFGSILNTAVCDLGLLYLHRIAKTLPHFLPTKWVFKADKQIKRHDDFSLR